MVSFFQEVEMRRKTRSPWTSLSSPCSSILIEQIFVYLISNSFDSRTLVSVSMQEHIKLLYIMSIIKTYKCCRGHEKQVWTVSVQIQSYWTVLPLFKSWVGFETRQRIYTMILPTQSLSTTVCSKTEKTFRTKTIIRIFIGWAWLLPFQPGLLLFIEL